MHVQSTTTLMMRNLQGSKGSCAAVRTYALYQTVSYQTVVFVPDVYIVREACMPRQQHSNTHNTS